LGGFNWWSQRLIVEGCDGQAGWVLSIDQPTTKRENASSTTAQ
jgi:hypothetical protein